MWVKLSFNRILVKIFMACIIIRRLIILNINVFFSFVRLFFVMIMALKEKIQCLFVPRWMWNREREEERALQCMWKGSHIVFIYEPNHDQINKRTTMRVEQKASQNAMVLKDGCRRRSHTIEWASEREKRKKKNREKEVIYHLAFFFSSCSLKRLLKRITDYLCVDSFSSSSHLLFRLLMHTSPCALLFAKKYTLMILEQNRSNTEFNNNGRRCTQDNE